MKPRRWISAGAVIALALTLITIRSLDAPLFLYPSSASLPAGLYMRSFEPVQTGTIVAFAVPDVAKRYKQRAGRHVPPGYLFIKPVAAGPGDRVCNDPLKGLRINGVWKAHVFQADGRGKALPIWRSCRQLLDDEYFMLSQAVSNSFDSRYYGPVPENQIISTYQSLL